MLGRCTSKLRWCCERQMGWLKIACPWNHLLRGGRRQELVVSYIIICCKRHQIAQQSHTVSHSQPIKAENDQAETKLIKSVDVAPSASSARLRYNKRNTGRMASVSPSSWYRGYLDLINFNSIWHHLTISDIEYAKKLVKLGSKLNLDHFGSCSQGSGTTNSSQ